MKIIAVRQLAIPDIKVVRYGRFPDPRGYFTETFRQADFDTRPELEFLAGVRFVQVNESHSLPGVVRGLHFQWNPHQGKFIRVVQGRMVDIVMDIRLGSPWFGQAIAHDMPSRPDMDWAEWLWAPPGFAHGNFFTEPTTIEYFCTAPYSPSTEAGISPLAADIDWSLCDPTLKELFDRVAPSSRLLSDKDRAGLTVAAWRDDPRAGNFVHGRRYH